MEIFKTWLDTVLNNLLYPTKVDHQSRLQWVCSTIWTAGKSSFTKDKNLYFSNRDTCTRVICADVAVSIKGSEKKRTPFLQKLEQQQISGMRFILRPGVIHVYQWVNPLLRACWEAEYWNIAMLFDNALQACIWTRFSPKYPFLSW